MSSQRDSKRDANARLKSRILSSAAAGPACLVLSAVVSLPLTAEAAQPVDPAAVQAAVASLHVRGAVAGDRATTEGAGASEKQWWHNGWVQPWGNWNNWHNWPNWHNWHNWGGGGWGRRW